MVYIENEKKTNFQVKIRKIVESIQGVIDTISVSIKEPLDIWLLTTKNGRIMVWNRKNLRRNEKPALELQAIYELEYYLADNYKYVDDSKMKGILKTK